MLICNHEIVHSATRVVNYAAPSKIVSVMNLSQRAKCNELNSAENRLKEDVTAIKIMVAKLQQNLIPDADRLLVILSAGGDGSDRLLLSSIPALIDEAQEAKVHLDVLLGLNNGTVVPQTNALLKEKNGIVCKHLYVREPRNPAGKRKLTDKTDMPFLMGKPEGHVHRVFLVNQQASESNKGKIRMLRDIYPSVVNSILGGWQAPEYTLVCDAETRIVPASGLGRKPPSRGGLRILFEHLRNEPELQIVGTVNRFVVYTEQTDGSIAPDYELSVPAMQFFLNLVHAHRLGFMWMPGGGTIGRTPVLAAILSVVANRYPGARIEDVMTTVLAKQADIRGHVMTSVASINRCLSAKDPRSHYQIERWLSGFKGLRDHYGLEKIRFATNPPGILRTLSSSSTALAREVVRLRSVSEAKVFLDGTYRMIRVLPRYLRLRRDAVADQLVGESTKAHWDSLDEGENRERRGNAHQ